MTVRTSPTTTLCTRSFRYVSLPRRSETQFDRSEYLRKDSSMASQSGMTLIEIIIVIGLMVVMISVAAPNLFIGSETEKRSKLNRVAEDVRSAFDMAVLTGRAHRMVFNFSGSDYWLEVTDREDFRIGDDELDRDLTADEEKEAQVEFDEKMKDYEQLAGQEFKDPFDGQVILPTSPILKMRDQLRPPDWKIVDFGEWGRRVLAPELVIISVQTEHHRSEQTLESTGEGGRAIVYFFPSGYVERAVIRMTETDYLSDPNRPPITFLTEPFEGSAETFYENKDFDVSRGAQKKL